MSSCAHMQQLYAFLGREAAFDDAGYLATLQAFGQGRLVWLPDEQPDSSEQQVPGRFYACNVLRYADSVGLLQRLPPGLVQLRALAATYPALQHFFCSQLRALPKLKRTHNQKMPPSLPDSVQQQQQPLVAAEPSNADYCACLVALGDSDDVSREAKVRLAGLVLAKWAAAFEEGSLQREQVWQLAAALKEARVLPVSNTGEGLACLAEVPLLPDDPAVAQQVNGLPGVLLLQVGCGTGCARVARALAQCCDGPAVPACWLCCICALLLHLSCCLCCSLG